MFEKKVSKNRDAKVWSGPDHQDETLAWRRYDERITRWFSPQAIRSNEAAHWWLGHCGDVIDMGRSLCRAITEEKQFVSLTIASQAR